MGLKQILKDTVANVGGSFGSALVGGAHDMFYREYITSGSMAGNILMKRGERVLDGKKNSNVGSNGNIITNGSYFDVQVNQCLIIVDNGAITEFTTVPGRYVYDQSSAPSCFFEKGRFNLGGAAKEVQQRWTAGGGRTTTQRAYYINLGKVFEPVYWGTGNITFRNCFTATEGMPPIINLITLRGHGTCEVRVSDPLALYCELGAQLAGGDNNGLLTVNDAGILDTLKTSINAAIGRAISELGQEKAVDYSAIGSYLDDITEKINARLANNLGKKGLSVFHFEIDGTLAPNDEDMKKLDESYQQYREASFFGMNQNMANYNLQREKIRVFEGIGQNEGAGGANLMGVGLGTNMMGMGLGGGVGNLQFTPQGNPPQAQQPVQAQPVTPVQTVPTAPTWACACGTSNTGKFCVNCGSSKPDANNQQTAPNTSWTCSCGASNTTKFCSNCGAKKPAVKKYQCDKCGWKPADNKPVRFCPECGDVFDDSDVIEE